MSEARFSPMLVSEGRYIKHLPHSQLDWELALMKMLQRHLEVSSECGVER